MPLSQHIILGVHITDRVHHVDPVQHLLTVQAEAGADAAAVFGQAQLDRATRQEFTL
jgi:hypothetical protein